jgi:plasmid maintenance system killer protein
MEGYFGRQKMDGCELFISCSKMKKLSTPFQVSLFYKLYIITFSYVTSSLGLPDPYSLLRNDMFSLFSIWIFARYGIPFCWPAVDCSCAFFEDEIASKENEYILLGCFSAAM